MASSTNRATIAVLPNSKEGKVKRYSENKWINLITIELRARHMRGVKLSKIAADTGLCTATVSRFVHNETKSPHMNTIVALLKYLGYKLYAEK